MSFSVKELKKILADNKIKGRSTLKTKDDIIQELTRLELMPDVVVPRKSPPGGAKLPSREPSACTQPKPLSVSSIDHLIESAKVNIHTLKSVQKVADRHVIDALTLLTQHLLTKHHIVGCKIIFVVYPQPWGASTHIDMNQKPPRVVDISFDKAAMLACTAQKMIDVVYHEIGHMLSTSDLNHGEVWKKKVREIGGRPGFADIPATDYYSGTGIGLTDRRSGRKATKSNIRTFY